MSFFWYFVVPCCSQFVQGLRSLFVCFFFWGGWIELYKPHLEKWVCTEFLWKPSTCLTGFLRWGGDSPNVP